MQYEHLARGLKRVVTEDPEALSAKRLAAVTTADVQSWVAPHELPLIEERVAKLREVGAVLAADFDGDALNLVRAARNSAVRLVRLVTAYFPGFRDHAVYGGRQVFFYKRAQIFAADVWGAYGCRTSGDSPGAFPDIGSLTIFSDYRVPQLLRNMGVLRYSPALASTIDLDGELPPGSPEEVEIRACTIVAVEQLRTLINRKLLGRSCSESSTASTGMLDGSNDTLPAAPAHASPAGSGNAGTVTSVAIDWYLWNEGERQKRALLPHHKTLTCFY